MIEVPYNPRNWYWILGADENRAWSSAAAAYVTEWDADRVTRIANEVELYDALAKSGFKTRAPQGPFDVEEVRAALLNIDAAATGDAQTYSELAAAAEAIDFALPRST